MITYYSDGTLFGEIILAIGIIIYIGLAALPASMTILKAFLSVIPSFLLGIAVRAALYSDSLLVIPPVPFFVVLGIQFIGALLIFSNLKRYSENKSKGWWTWFLVGGFILFLIIPPVVLQIMHY